MVVVANSRSVLSDSDGVNGDDFDWRRRNQMQILLLLILLILMVRRTGGCHGVNGRRKKAEG